MATSRWNQTHTEHIGIDMIERQWRDYGIVHNRIIADIDHRQGLSNIVHN